MPPLEVLHCSGMVAELDQSAHEDLWRVKDDLVYSQKVCDELSAHVRRHGNKVRL